MSVKIEKASDLLRFPIAWLLGVPWADLRKLMREPVLPNDSEMESLYRAVALRTLRILQQEPKKDALEKEADEIQRLIPHQVRAELDARSTSWSSRILAYSDLLLFAADSIELREKT